MQNYAESDARTAVYVRTLIRYLRFRLDVGIILMVIVPLEMRICLNNRTFLKSAIAGLHFDMHFVTFWRTSEKNYVEKSVFYPDKIIYFPNIIKKNIWEQMYYNIAKKILRKSICKVGFLRFLQSLSLFLT